MGREAGKGSRPRPTDLKKKDECPLWKKNINSRLKPGEKYTKVYSK